jgi:hypothetical protein
MTSFIFWNKCYIWVRKIIKRFYLIKILQEMIIIWSGKIRKLYFITYLFMEKNLVKNINFEVIVIHFNFKSVN